MPKLDALVLAPLEAPAETRSFADPAQPGQTLTLTLKEPDFPDYAYAQETAARMTAVWVEAPNGKLPPRFPPPPGRPIRWSRRLCEVVALIEALEAPEDPEEAYDALELAVLSVRMPKAWSAVSAWVTELEGRYLARVEESAEGNAPAAPG